MAEIYQPDVLVTDDKLIVPLKYIESIKIVRDIDSEQAVVDKLKGDIIIEVRTLSGNQFLISMLDLYERLGTNGMPSDPAELYNALCNKWIRSI